jgi:ABC-type polar amino acid transport system ATPase subunit
VLDNIICPKGSAQEKIQESRQSLICFNKVGIEEKSGAYPLQLSGGQQQACGHCRALAMNPNDNALREPTSASIRDDN